MTGQLAGRVGLDLSRGQIVLEIAQKANNSIITLTAHVVGCLNKYHICRQKRP